MWGYERRPRTDESGRGLTDRVLRQRLIASPDHQFRCVQPSDLHLHGVVGPLADGRIETPPWGFALKYPVGCDAVGGGRLKVQRQMDDGLLCIAAAVHQYPAGQFVLGYDLRLMVPTLLGNEVPSKLQFVAEVFTRRLPHERRRRRVRRDGTAGNHETVIRSMRNGESVEVTTRFPLRGRQTHCLNSQCTPTSTWSHQPNASTIYMRRLNERPP